MPRPAFKIGPIDRIRTSRVGVIDIGSNSIRLVVYDRLARSPTPVFNEKVLCGLGRDLPRTGRLNPDGVRLAIANLSRFVQLLEGMKVDRVDVLATAAVREADDGEAFVAEVHRRNGLRMSIVSGAEEARLSAMGVLSGQPGADGVMGDLGGASLELVGLDRARIGEQVTLPLGPFRLMGVHQQVLGAVRKVVADRLAEEEWLANYRGRTFYPVGGAWRTLAKIHMIQRGHPVHIIHQYAVPASDLAQLAGLIARQQKGSLEKVAGVSKRRLETLPYAALAMEGLLAALKPRDVVFSAFGLREGHLFDLLSPEERALDPLIEGCLDIASSHDRFGKVGRLADWISGLFAEEQAPHARLRRAASLLSDFCWDEHPDYRSNHAFFRTLRLPIAGLGHADRVFLASALYARYGGNPGDRLTRSACDLLNDDDRVRASLVGAALRLGHTLSGGAVSVLDDTRLQLTDDAVLLWLPADNECLGGDVVQRRLDSVAKALGRRGRIMTARPEELRVGA